MHSIGVKKYAQFRDAIITIAKAINQNESLLTVTQKCKVVSDILQKHDTLPEFFHDSCPYFKTFFNELKMIFLVLKNKHVSEKEILLMREKGHVELLEESVTQMAKAFAQYDHVFQQELTLEVIDFDELLKAADGELPDVAILDTNFVHFFRKEFLAGKNKDFKITHETNIIYPPQLLTENTDYNRQKSLGSMKILRELSGQKPFSYEINDFYRELILTHWIQTRKAKLETKKLGSIEAAKAYFIQTADFVILHEALVLAIKKHKVIILSDDKDIRDTLRLFTQNTDFHTWSKHICQVTASHHRLKKVA